MGVMRSLWRTAFGERGFAIDRFLSSLGGSELSWPSPSEEAWAVSGASVRAMASAGVDEAIKVGIGNLSKEKAR
jgi:hypothetical protein